MKLLIYSVILSAIVIIQLKAQDINKNEAYKFEGEKYFNNIRMLTESGENAEAYFSFDNEKLIFQASVGNMECDQIFIMNIDGSGKKMVSTGKGRTTCAYYYPDNNKILYASTHHFDDGCLAAPDRSRGYVWKLYDEFDIFMANEDGSELVQLTNSGKYDAEATISPKGDKIVFTSTRDGDPELYIMDLDGNNQTRLTYEKGYDGGAFFSPDGERIVFRASRPETEDELKDYDELVKENLLRPTRFEIFIMDADGNNLEQVTNLGKASFAPFFHPSGEKIIFSSNYGAANPRDFNLFLINIDGTNLEQITYSGEFDGFPMFTSDGKHLVFASNRFNKNSGDTNIFITEWNED
jgi:Tol biopolymer transport system component